MKKISEFFERLSLARQLLILLAVLSIIILLVIHPIIHSKLNKISDHQIYREITSQQELVQDMFENMNHETLQDRDPLNLQFNERMSVKHLLYDASSSTLRILSDIPGRDAWQIHQVMFEPIISEMIQKNESEHLSYTIVQDDTRMYFVIRESSVNSNQFWISFELREVNSELFQEIQKELINVLYIVMFIVALALIVWIYTIIRPLKQIQTYIRLIKQGQSFTLHLKRHDEIGEVGEALIDMDRELKKQKQLQIDLIHNISHDLKTPITIIRSYSESMKEDIYPYGDKNSSLDVIIENSHRLEKKVKDFLYLNRLDYVKETMHNELICEMKPLILDIITEFQPLYPNLQFICELDNVNFKGSEEHWRSCVTNIIENGLRYAKSKIIVKLNTDDLQIMNDGEAMSEEILNSLFKPYSKGPKGNFGLGMSIVYKIVHLYGYQIEASNIENGVCFSIKKDT